MRTLVIRLSVAAAILGIFAIFPLHAYAQTQDVSNGPPYETMFDYIFANNDPSVNQKFFDVPAGKRLVVRNVSGILYGPKDEKYKLIILSNDGGDDTWHPVAITGELFSDPEANAYAKIFSVPTYFNARRDPTKNNRAYAISLVRSDQNLNHPTFVKITVSGYLVDDLSIGPRGQ